MVIKMRKKSKLVYGIGINDSEHSVFDAAGGETCKIYKTWHDMIGRCYSEKIHKKNPTYKNCTMHEDWVIFSNFRAWMQNQDWEGKQLDKDLLVYGNKVYSPSLCVFVDANVNSFLTENKNGKNKLTGAFFHKSTGKYQASCKNPFTKKLEYLGLFDDESKAHLAWKKRKHELACQLADLQADDRVSAALRVRYL